MRQVLFACLAVSAITFVAGRPAHAQAVVTYSFDEFGNGSGTGPGGTESLPGALAFDPGPGGLALAMTYSGLGNPPSLVAGDVLLFEPGTGNTLSDIVRFNPAGTGGNPAYRNTLVFYSDNADTGEVPTPADTGFPISFYANTVNVREFAIGPNDHEAIYTPLAGQPGFIAGFAATYTLISSTPPPSVPEPSSIASLAVGLGGAALWLWRRRRRVAS
jgi:hypothetical protein